MRDGFGKVRRDCAVATEAGNGSAPLRLSVDCGLLKWRIVNYLLSRLNASVFYFVIYPTGRLTATIFDPVSGKPLDHLVDFVTVEGPSGTFHFNKPPKDVELPTGSYIVVFYSRGRILGAAGVEIELGKNATVSAPSFIISEEGVAPPPLRVQDVTTLVGLVVIAALIISLFVKLVRMRPAEEGATA